MSRYGGPPAAGAAGGRQIALPNQTIYINNLNDKLPKQQLRRCRTRARCRLARTRAACEHSACRYACVILLPRRIAVARSRAVPAVAPSRPRRGPHSLRASVFSPCVQRTVRALLAVWRHPGRSGIKDAQDARTGICSFPASHFGVDREGTTSHKYSN